MDTKKKTNLKYLLTLEEIRAKFETEVLKWDITTVKRKRQSPIERWNSDDTQLKSVSYHEFLLYASVSNRRVVGKKGISLDGKEYISSELPSVGSEVEIRVNIDNVAELFVFDAKGNFICIARDKEIYPMSLESLKTVKKAFKEDMRSIKKVINSAEFSDFTKLNVAYDLQKMKEAHTESLKRENFIQNESIEVKNIKSKIRRQKETEAIKEMVFEYGDFESSTKKSSKTNLIDKAIENSLKAV